MGLLALRAHFDEGIESRAKLPQPGRVKVNQDLQTLGVNVARGFGIHSRQPQALDCCVVASAESGTNSGNAADGLPRWRVIRFTYGRRWLGVQSGRRAGASRLR
jgi:hypothetical protein